MCGRGLLPLIAICFNVVFAARELICQDPAALIPVSSSGASISAPHGPGTDAAVPNGSRSPAAAKLAGTPARSVTLTTRPGAVHP